MPDQCSILVYGHDPLLLETRRWILERASFQVYVVAHKLDARKLAETEAIDLFLLCHTLSTSDRDVALTSIHALRPEMKLLLVTTSSDDAPVGAWETVDSLAGAESMVFAVRKALSVGRH